MRPVEQTLFYPPDGDCFRACLASILELAAADLPNPHGEDWYDEWLAWAEPRNFTLHGRSYHKGGLIPLGYAIQGCRLPGSRVQHAVVCYHGALVWDPHPLPIQGLVPRDWTIVVPLDPSQPVGRSL